MLSAFISKLEKLDGELAYGLPMDSKIRLARKFLLWTLNNPGPPVDTGYLKSSGSGWVGSTQVVGGEPRLKVNAPYNVITITYSAPKTRSHYHSTRWFDYAEYQHERHATNRLWALVLLQKGVDVAVGREFRRTWSKIF